VPGGAPVLRAPPEGLIGEAVNSRALSCFCVVCVSFSLSLSRIIVIVFTRIYFPMEKSARKVLSVGTCGRHASAWKPGDAATEGAGVGEGIRLRGSRAAAAAADVIDVPDLAGLWS